MIFQSPWPEVEIPDVTVTPYVFRHADRLADKISVIDGPTGRSYTYAELAGAVRKAAGGLVAAGLARGEVVAILSPNIPEYAIVFHAVAWAGGTVTTINPTFTVDEVSHQLSDSRARALVTIPHFLDQAMAAAARTGVEAVFVLGPAAGGAGSFFRLLAADPIDQAPVDPSTHVVTLPYSSGTTGLPKGVELTHRNLVANLAQTEPTSTVTEDEIILAVLPFFHIYGMQVLMNGALFRGATTVTMPRFDLAEFLQTIADHRVTRVAAVPPIVVALAKHPMVADYDLSSLAQIGSGAAPLGADVEAEARLRTGADVVQGFGLTETSPVTHTALPGGPPRPGSIGVPVPNTEIRVVDTESGEDLGVGERGELWIRGPQVMKGYRNNPAATAATIVDGWLRSGDIGWVDADDHWYITDRLKELIKYKGFQVAPAELEAVLLTHPAVADAAVIGVTDEVAGEVPKAFIVVEQGRQVTVDEVIAHVAERVAPYKRVREVEIIDEIPKSLAGKILRRVLREREGSVSNSAAG